MNRLTSKLFEALDAKSLRELCIKNLPWWNENDRYNAYDLKPFMGSTNLLALDLTKINEIGDDE